MSTRANAVDKRRMILDAAIRVFAREGFHRCRVSAIQIQDVGERVERVKRNANGQDHLQHAELVRPDRREDVVQRLGGEHVIFEESKETQIRHHTGQHRELSLSRGGAGSGDDLAPNKLQDGREQHEADEPRLPPAVKNIAGENQEEVLAAPRQRPVSRKNDREKDEIS